MALHKTGKFLTLLTAMLQLYSVQTAAQESTVKFGLTAGYSLGSGQLHDDFSNEERFTYDIRSTLVGLALNFGRQSSLFNYRMSLDFVDGDYDLDPGQRVSRGPRAGVERADQKFYGMTMTHSLQLRPTRGPFWIGPSLYFGTLDTRDRQFGGTSPSNQDDGDNDCISSIPDFELEGATGAVGVSLGWDFAADGVIYALEAGYRKGFATPVRDIADGEEKDGEFDDAVLRLSVLFGKARSLAPAVEPPVKVVPVSDPGV